MKCFWKLSITVGLITHASLAHAALWSLSNEVLAPPYGIAEPVLSITGDGQLVGAQIDVIIPSYLGVANARSLGNSSFCVVRNIDGKTVVRALVLDNFNRPIASVPTPICTFALTSLVPVPSAFFEYGYSQCVNSAVNAYPCQLDRGYLTVVPSWPEF